MRELGTILSFASFSLPFDKNTLLRTEYVNSIPTLLRKDYEPGHILCREKRDDVHHSVFVLEKKYENPEFVRERYFLIILS